MYSIVLISVSNNNDLRKEVEPISNLILITLAFVLLTWTWVICYSYAK